ncbi:hypothetical protein ACLQ28_21450 [Micromonospora sp. DT201]|uniref:hypothetical protein n=1 Tax=Micromonospora sp. DT201 TaxID=3393442 RepID=UPI003CF8EB3A
MEAQRPNLLPRGRDTDTGDADAECRSSRGVGPQWRTMTSESPVAVTAPVVGSSDTTSGMPWADVVLRGATSGLAR